ncbi:type IV pilus modification protein PilV [Azotobacter beijerinckii]|uniref:type IV pilus modification protein PilV n=1 Tax=Azotobacter beijerinckii TaxID=170623 RepID=UPI0029541B79|nr:type IV pilus modification protein PilV [Azotobacter beijerinckii]MDV7210386.1 type IV pilus modification protein PilV [Azotobacter beijerinckii]
MRVQWARQRGVTLIEVLVTVLILSIGLLGMAGLQVRLQQSEMEAYQRAQALLLLSDMANRIAANRNAANAYRTEPGSSIGVDSDCGSSTGTESRAEIDLREWCDALQGAAETTGSNASKVGAMLGGRGCVESPPGSNEYLITVAWQGSGPISAPPASVACGADEYDGGSACADDLCRRVVTTIVRIADL